MDPFIFVWATDEPPPATPAARQVLETVEVVLALDCRDKPKRRGKKAAQAKREAKGKQQ